MNIKSFAKILSKLVKAKGASGKYLPKPGVLSEEMFTEAINIGLVGKDTSSFIVADQDLSSVVNKINGIKDILSGKDYNDDYRARFLIVNEAIPENVRQTLNDLIAMEARVKEARDFMKTVWCTGITGKAEVEQAMKEAQE